MKTIFLHGFLGQPDDWQPVTQQLPDEDCVPVELPEAGNWSDAVSSLLTTCPSRCNLVGYSMGARLALAFALEAPHRVNSLCFVSGNPGLDETARSSRREHDQSVARQLLETDFALFLERWYAQPLFANVAASTRSAWVQRASRLDRQRQANLLRGLSIGGQPDYRSRLNELKMPTQLIVGAQDTKYVKIAESMLAQAPQLNLHKLDAGHAVAREQPAALARVIRRFLSTANSPSQPSTIGTDP